MQLVLQELVHLLLHVLAVIGILLSRAVGGAVPVGWEIPMILYCVYLTSPFAYLGHYQSHCPEAPSCLEVSSATACSGPRLVSPDTPPLFGYWHPSSLRRACCHHHSISAQDRRRNLLVLRWDCKGLDTCKHGDRLKRFSPHVHPDGLISFTRTRN